MLLEFRITNFVSFQETQTLSMVAAKDNSHAATNCLESGIAVTPQLLSSAVLYGANASGKSNLIAGLAFMLGNVVLTSTNILDGQTFNLTPFRLNSQTKDQPTEFEITFVENTVRYQYGFSLTAKQVFDEWLLAYPHDKAQRWFERSYNSTTGEYNWHFGSHLLGGKQRSDWKKRHAIMLSFCLRLCNGIVNS